MRRGLSSRTSRTCVDCCHERLHQYRWGRSASRRQLGAIITIEAITTAVFGTLVDLGLAVALKGGLESQGLTTPANSQAVILAMLLASGVVGVLATALPSIRAVRLNILRALASSRTPCQGSSRLSRQARSASPL